MSPRAQLCEQVVDCSTGGAKSLSNMSAAATTAAAATA